MAKHGGDTGDVYIGSTTKVYLCQRMDGHRSHYKQWKNDKYHYVTVYGIFEKYGIENCCIVLLELVNASNIDELMARERHWIQSMPCVNKIIPGRTNAEYYVVNHEQILANKTQYYVVNHEQVLVYQAQYRADNRKIIRDKKAENIQCECGCIVNRSHLLRHRKSQKHLVKLEINQSNAPTSSDSHTQLKPILEGQYTFPH
jgi:hypothetical protein